MSCTKDKVIKDMLKQQLVSNQRLEITTTLPSKNLTDYIDKITKLAKNKYGVDAGPLFNIRFVTTTVGDYRDMGPRSEKTKIVLEPNDEAFIAIDKSAMTRKNEQEKEVADARIAAMKRMMTDNTAREEEGQYEINEEGDVVVPSYLPKINVQC